MLLLRGAQVRKAAICCILALLLVNTLVLGEDWIVAVSTDNVNWEYYYNVTNEQVELKDIEKTVNLQIVEGYGAKFLSYGGPHVIGQFDGPYEGIFSDANDNWIGYIEIYPLNMEWQNSSETPNQPAPEECDPLNINCNLPTCKDEQIYGLNKDRLYQIQFICGEEISPVLCMDQTDNDLDGKIDCEDSDCVNLQECYTFNQFYLMNNTFLPFIACIDSSCDPGYSCQDNACKLSETKCTANVPTSCSLNPECVRFPKCNVLGKAFLEIFTDPGDWSNHQSIRISGSSCDQTCSNIDKFCVSSGTISNGTSGGFSDCNENQKCGSGTKTAGGYCVAPGEGKGTHLSDYDEATCAKGDGCVATDTDGRACLPKDPDCGSATCGAGDGIVWGCEELIGRSMDPDIQGVAGFGSCDSGDGCVFADKSRSDNPLTEVTLCHGDEDCGTATCNAGDGCVRNCWKTLSVWGLPPKPSYPFIDPDCEDIKTNGIEMCSSENECAAGYYDSITKNFINCPTKDVDCGKANCTEGNGCVLGCTPKDPDCGSTDACNAESLENCGEANCTSGNGCVLGCTLKDPDCGTDYVCDGPGALKYTCNAPGECQCYTEIDRSCDCYEMGTRFLGTCYYENNPNGSKVNLFSSNQFYSEEDFLDSEENLKVCCQSGFGSTGGIVNNQSYLTTIPQSWEYKRFGRNQGFDKLYDVISQNDNHHDSYLVTCSIGEFCNDGIDNDGNGKKDCEDPTCTNESSHFTIEVKKFCYGTGAEKVCYNLPPKEYEGTPAVEEKQIITLNGKCEPNQELTCNDQIDNDGDGLRDCQDPDCVGKISSPYWPTLGVVCEIPEALCYDGKDNDNDYDILTLSNDFQTYIKTRNPEGGIDCQDFDCKNKNKEVCDNNFDDDCDNLVDCQDDQCNNQQCGSITFFRKKICSQGACVAPPEAGTAKVEKNPEISFFTYADILKFLHDGKVIRGSGDCNNMCAQSSLVCGFAQGGKNTCKDPSSTYCTCYTKQ